MQDQCVDSQLSWPDINCASQLCFKGMCKHKIKEAAGLTDDWLCQCVTPQISAVFGKKVGAILAKPLLWACFSDTFAERVQPQIRQRICGQFIRLERDGFEQNGVNPVETVEVIPNESKSASAASIETEILSLNPLLYSPMHLAYPHLVHPQLLGQSPWMR